MRVAGYSNSGPAFGTLFTGRGGIRPSFSLAIIFVIVYGKRPKQIRDFRL